MSAVQRWIGVGMLGAALAVQAQGGAGEGWAEVPEVSPVAATTGKAPPTRYFVQWASLQVAGDIRSVQTDDEVGRDLADTGFRSVRQQMEFDCRNVTFRVLMNKAYSGSFGEGAELPAPPAQQQWTVVERSTRATALQRAVCRAPKPAGA